jgi:hypothetical protein
VTLRATRALLVTSKNIAVSGQSVALVLNRKLTVTSGAVALSGQAVDLRAARMLAVNAGAATLTGSDVTLTAASAYDILVTSGSIMVAGQSVTLRSARTLAVTAGSIAATGSQVTLTAGRVLSITPANIAVSGSVVALAADRTLAVTPGSIVALGASVAMTVTVVTPPAAEGSAGSGGRSAGAGFIKYRDSARPLDQRPVARPQPYMGRADPSSVPTFVSEEEMARIVERRREAAEARRKANPGAFTVESAIPERQAQITAQIARIKAIALNPETTKTLADLSETIAQTRTFLDRARQDAIRRADEEDEDDIEFLLLSME